MTRDLDTLLRDAVATTPVDTDAVLDRAGTIRRRRTTGRAVAALAVLAVVGVGVTSLLDDDPVAPIVGTDPIEVEDALVPVLPAAVVDAALPLLRVDVDVADVPQLPDLGQRPSDATDGGQHVVAVGPDGTWAAVAGGARRTLVVGGPDRPTTRHTTSSVELAAVLPDGSVLAGLAAGPGAAIDRLLHVEDGVATTSVLATQVPVPVDAPRMVVQDPERVTFAVRTRAGSWQELLVWVAGDGVVTEDALRAVPRELAATWERDSRVGEDGRRSRIGRGDGAVLEIGRSDRRDPANGSTWSEQVVAGRWAQGLGWIDETADPVSVVAVFGPGDAAAVVPVRLPLADDDWAELAEPLLAVDGSLWLRTRDGAGALRIVPAGGLPETTTDAEPVPGLDPGALPELPAAPPAARAVGESPDVLVLPVGERGTVPAGVTSGRSLHDALPAGCCWLATAVAPDGTLALWAEPLGLDSRGRDVQVVTPDGATSRVVARDLYGTEVDGPLLAFDESGNLWALADRWWSHAGFPDLVVRRPGATSFTSLGHLPLTDLLDTDAGRVEFHVEGDEVALVGWRTDAAGREVLAGRVVVARDGAAVRAEDREAFALPGPSPAITSGTMRPHLRVGVVGDDREASLSGPFLGPAMPAQVEHDADYVGFPHRADLVGGLVVADGYDEDEDVTTVLVSDRAGVTAAVRVAGLARPLAAADGSVWAVTVVDGVGERFVQVLDAAWRTVS